jgi:hypothetical protein
MSPSAVDSSVVLGSAAVTLGVIAAAFIFLSLLLGCVSVVSTLEFRRDELHPVQCSRELTLKSFSSRFASSTGRAQRDQLGPSHTCVTVQVCLALMLAFSLAVTVLAVLGLFGVTWAPHTDNDFMWFVLWAASLALSVSFYVASNNPIPSRARSTRVANSVGGGFRDGLCRPVCKLPGCDQTCSSRPDGGFYRFCSAIHALIARGEKKVRRARVRGERRHRSRSMVSSGGSSPALEPGAVEARIQSGDSSPPTTLSNSYRPRSVSDALSQTGNGSAPTTLPDPYHSRPHSPFFQRAESPDGGVHASSFMDMSGPWVPSASGGVQAGSTSVSSSSLSPTSVMSRRMGAGRGGRGTIRNSPVRGIPLIFCLSLLAPTVVESVTCFTCHDQVPGCTGQNCPFAEVVAQNTAVMAGNVAQGDPTSLSCTHLLPLRILRYFPRTTLDMLKVVSTRPAAGTPIDLLAMSHEDLIAAVNGGSTYLSEALREVARRIAAATTQIEIARLSALQSTLASIEKTGAALGGAVSGAAAGAIMGAYTFVYYRATAVTRGDAGVAVAGLISEDGGGDDSTRRASTAMLTARISRPSSFAEFMDSLSIWVMVCAACGIAHVLTTTVFLRDVVHDTILKLKEPWQVAHELFLVYLEKLENASGNAITMFTVFSNGAHDTLMQRAKDRAKRAFPALNGNGIFREGGRRQDDDDERRRGSSWNGAFNRDANAKCCITFNMGRKNHPDSCLDSKGACRFAHACDKFVTDKGPGGICRSTKHHRGTCDNPNRCETAVE